MLYRVLHVQEAESNILVAHTDPSLLLIVNSTVMTLSTFVALASVTLTISPTWVPTRAFISIDSTQFFSSNFNTCVCHFVYIQSDETENVPLSVTNT